jgi:hypothetical protein
MKTSLSLIVTMAVSLCQSQIHPELPEHKGKIEQIVQKQYGFAESVLSDTVDSRKSLTGSSEYTGVKNTLTFYKNGTLKSKQVEIDKFLLLKEMYTYDTVGNTAIRITNYSTEKEEKSFTRKRTEVLLSEEGLPLSMRTMLEPPSYDPDLIHRRDYDAVYSEGKLVSYKHVDLDAAGDTIHKTIFKIRYDSDERIIEVSELTNGFYAYYAPNVLGKKTLISKKDNESKVIQRWVYTYTADGNLETTTHMLLAGYFSPEEREAKVIYSYTYDTKGNWTERYKQVGNNLKALDIKQKIKYR